MIVNMNYAKSIIGDINYDGYITMEDVELLMQYLATGNYIDKRIADVNNDELIDVADAIQISRFINGNDTNYNIGKEITLDSLLGDLNSDGKISVTSSRTSSRKTYTSSLPAQRMSSLTPQRHITS